MLHTLWVSFPTRLPNTFFLFSRNVCQHHGVGETPPLPRGCARKAWHRATLCDLTHFGVSERCVYQLRSMLWVRPKTFAERAWEKGLWLLFGSRRWIPFRKSTRSEEWIFLCAIQLPVGGESSLHVWQRLWMSQARGKQETKAIHFSGIENFSFHLVYAFLFLSRNCSCVNLQKPQIRT